MKIELEIRKLLNRNKEKNFNPFLVLNTVIIHPIISNTIDNSIDSIDSIQ